MPAGAAVISKDDRPGDERLSTNDQDWFPVSDVHNFRNYHSGHNMRNTFRSVRDAEEGKVESPPREGPSEGETQVVRKEASPLRCNKR